MALNQFEGIWYTILYFICILQVYGTVLYIICRYMVHYYIIFVGIWYSIVLYLQVYGTVFYCICRYMVQYLDTPDTAQKIFLDLPRRREALGVSRSHGLNIQSSPGQYYMYYYYKSSPGQYYMYYYYKSSHGQYITITHTAHFILYTLLFISLS